jgi:hypothetical protein
MGFDREEHYIYWPNFFQAGSQLGVRLKITVGALHMYAVLLHCA